MNAKVRDMYDRKRAMGGGFRDSQWPLVPGPEFPTNTATQSGWGGIVFNSTSPITSLTMTYTTPSLVTSGSGEPGSDASIWVGIGNVWQNGSYMSYDTTKPGNFGFISTWTTYVGAGGNYIGQFGDVGTYSITKGDVITVTLSVSAGFWTSTIKNNTAGWTYVNKQSIQATAVGTGSYPFPFSQAEIIIEKEGANNLPNYGTIEFIDIAMTPAVDPTNITYVNTVNNGNTDQSGVLSGNTFTMTWSDYD